MPDQRSRFAIVDTTTGQHVSALSPDEISMLEISVRRLNKHHIKNRVRVSKKYGEGQVLRELGERLKRSTALLRKLRKISDHMQ